MTSKTNNISKNIKKCPFCAEKIQEEAIKCRFCGEFLDEKSLDEAFIKRKTDRSVFNIDEVADYLRVPVGTIEDWVKKRKMPFSRLPANKGVVFKRRDIDKWIEANTITEYDRFVYEKKTIDDILPDGYKPPTDDEMLMDYVRELHEKYIAKHSKKSGVPEEEVAKGLKKGFAKLSARVAGERVKFIWDFKKKKYILVEGKEAYNKHLKKDSGFQGVLDEMYVLMRYLGACY